MRRTRAGLATTVAFGLALTASAFALAGPAAAGSTAAGGSAVGEDVMDVQMRLIAAADRIRPSMAGTTGLAGITVEAEAGELRIYWKGDLPEPVRDTIDRERRTVAVSVLPARFSQGELEAAAPAILAENAVTGVAPLPDGSALLVSVHDDEPSARALPAIQNATVPIVIDPFMRPMVAAGRQQDTSPYSGGSTFHFPRPNNEIGVCTTGFAVQVAAVRKMLSAGHCRDDGDTVYEGNGTGPANAMGTISGKDATYDTLLIEADSTGAVYFGPYSSMSSKPIQTVINNYPHTLVCTSGAVTGQHCDIRIVAVNQTIKLDNVTIMKGLVRGEHRTHDVAAGLGDSGGPVVAQETIPADFLLVYPLGTISVIAGGGAKVDNCGPTLMDTECSWMVFYADINLALARYSATIVN